MAHAWRDSIYQWLSKATESAEPPPAQNTNNPSPVDSAKHFDSFPVDLEAHNTAQNSTRGKRTWAAGREEALGDHPPKKPRNEFDRRPRHKTREDRYDYKPKGSHGKSQSQGKTKRLRRGRKETMNDGFHASNVPRERLTLRKGANVGIFNKGKASSPIKHRDVPDLAFSETHFLSQRNSRVRKDSITVDMNELKDSGHKERAPYNCAQPRAERLAGTPLKLPGETPLQKRDKAADTQHPLSHAGTSGPGAHNVPGKDQGSAQKLQCQAEASEATSRSATPFSWSESEPSRTRLERAVDLRLLEVLHTGLSSVQGSAPGNVKRSQKQYCDLQELKALLNDRKAHWQPEEGSSDPGRPQGNNLQASAEDKKGASILPSPNPEVIPGNDSGLLLYQRPSGDKSRRSQGFDDSNQTVPITSSYEDRQLDQLHDTTVMVEAEVEDDEDFFRKLDEAFHEIMDPGCKEIDPMGERPAGKATPLRRETVASLLSDQLGFEVPHLGPSPVVGNLGEEPATCQNRHKSSRKFSYAPSHQGRSEQDVEDRYPTRSNQLLSVSTTPNYHATGVIPKGFWRQNRLY